MKNDNTNKTTNIVTSQPVACKHDHDPTQSQRVSSMFEETSSCTHFWASSSTHYLNYENKRVRTSQTTPPNSRNSKERRFLIIFWLYFFKCGNICSHIVFLFHMTYPYISVPFVVAHFANHHIRLWSLGAMKVASTVLRISCRWYTSLAKFTLGASVFLSQYCNTTTRIDTSNTNNKFNNTQPVKPRFLCHASEYMGNSTPWQHVSWSHIWGHTKTCYSAIQTNRLLLLLFLLLLPLLPVLLIVTLMILMKLIALPPLLLLLLLLRILDSYGLLLLLQEPEVLKRQTQHIKVCLQGIKSWNFHI